MTRLYTNKKVHTRDALDYALTEMTAYAPVDNVYQLKMDILQDLVESSFIDLRWWVAASHQMDFWEPFIPDVLRSTAETLRVAGIAKDEVYSERKAYAMGQVFGASDKGDAGLLIQANLLFDMLEPTFPVPDSGLAEYFTHWDSELPMLVQRIVEAEKAGR